MMFFIANLVNATDVAILPKKLAQNPLTVGTTAAFSIYLTSSPASGTITGKVTVYASSMTLEALNSNAQATTNYVNLDNSATDTLNELISSITALSGSYWTATLSAGCYGRQISSATFDGEGYTTGLQYDVGGKAVTFSTGSANAITLYLNGTLTISKYFEPVSGKKYAVQSISTNLISGTTMYVYEGDVSTNTTTLINIPITETLTKNYEPFTPLVQSSNNKALEFRVIYGTFSVITNNYQQIFLYMQ